MALTLIRPGAHFQRWDSFC